jgi:hypothetical protein
MYRLSRLTIFLFVIQINSLISGDLVLPDRIDDNWIIREPKRIYVGNKLFDHINGAAELFLEFGFNDLTVCKYSKENVTIELEVYKMENALAALGIYLIKTGQEKPLNEITARNTANLYQIVLTSGQYFILVNNFSGNKKLKSLMIGLCQKVVKQIKTSEVDDPFTHLPKQNMIRESQVLFRGPYGLQSIYTFGKGDILLLGGKIFGVGANYTSKTTKNITRLAIPYPDPEAAIKAYHNLVSNLDPYLEILEKLDNHFIFKDFNQEFGFVKIENNQILIQLHLLSKPK